MVTLLLECHVARVNCRVHEGVGFPAGKSVWVLKESNELVQKKVSPAFAGKGAEHFAVTWEKKNMLGKLTA